MRNKQSTFNRNPKTWLKDAWHLARPFWVSEQKYKALGLIGLVIIFNLLTVYMSVLFNKWNNGFYDAIQHYDKKTFFALLYKFMIMAFFFILFQVLSYYFRKLLEIRWRRWSTNFYLSTWFHKKSYYKNRFLNQISDNPDQRISEDVNGFIVLTLDLTLGLLSSVVTLVSFIIILWKISGVIEFNFLKHHYVVHGFMVYAALLYAIVGTYLTFKVGKKLIKLDFQQQAYEADFRYNLMRVREYSENIAFYNGEPQEQSGLSNRFNNVVNNFVAIIYRQMKIDILGISYSQLAVIFPMLVAAPRYFAKAIQLGDLMQILSAFGHVQGSLSYFINAYTSLSGWRAVMDRLYGFQTIMQDAADLESIAIKPGKNYLELSNFGINLPNGERLQKNIQISLSSGDRLLIRGRSGSGKTTTLRAIAGLWPFTHGEIYQTPNLNSLFIAQRTYLPYGSLKAAICYPKLDNLPTNDELIALLKQFMLKNFSDQLEEIADWGNKLSLGEQQRIAFCRILINKPDIIYLDEATSAVDEETEDLMYKTLVDTLPNSAIISVGHRSTIKHWHNQELNFSSLN
jgi:putative ATP-binding cassette transporter